MCFGGGVSRPQRPPPGSAPEMIYMHVEIVKRACILNSIYAYLFTQELIFCLFYPLYIIQYGGTIDAVDDSYLKYYSYSTMFAKHFMAEHIHTGMHS